MSTRRLAFGTSGNQMDFKWIGWCHEENHDKVWAIIALSESKYATIWGRRGKTLQSKVQDGYGSHQRTAIRGKKSKGYVEITKDRLAEVYPEFQDDLERTALWSMLGARY